jgi:YD repeat-containing protein
MTSANFGISLGYQGAATSPSSSTPLTLGPAGPGGQETLPPGRPSMTATLSLAGTTGRGGEPDCPVPSAEPPGPVAIDANGNYRVSNGKWIKFDSENRPIRIITGEGTKAEMTYDYTGQRVKRVVTSADGRVVKRTVYVGTIYEENDGIGTNYIHANNQRIAMKTGSTVYYFHQDRLGSASW